MHIRLKDTGTILDMKPDTRLSITLNNPMLKEQGSMSLPLALPRTPANVRSLGDVDIKSLYKYKRTRDVLVEAGVWQKQGLLRIASGSKELEGAVYMDESPMYARMKETEMSQAFDITRPASDFHVDGTFTTDLDMMIKYMELVMVGNIEDDFFLFPVATDHYNETIDIPAIGNTDFTFYQLLNEQMSSGTSSPDIIDIDLDGNQYFKLSGRNAQQYKSGSDWQDVPVGYGITPFLKQSYVLRRIFAYFGYELRESIFDTDPEFQKIAILNNTADAITKAQLKYSQLVPSVKISDYLQSVRTDYGCEFFISPDYKYVEVRFWNDILDNKDYIPLDDKISDVPVINLFDSKLIKLTNNRSLEFSDISFDTWNKFQDQVDPLSSISDFPLAPADGYYFVRSFGQIWERRTNNIGVPLWNYHSQALFDFYVDKSESTDDDYDTKDSKREHTAHLTVCIRLTDRSIPGGSPQYYLRMPFVDKRRHMNTAVKVHKQDADGNEEYLENENDTAKCPIMTAFYRGRMDTIFVGDSLRFHGHIFGYDDAGILFPGGFDLIFGGTNGLYNKFWTKYAAIILDSFNEVKIPLHLDIRDVMNFRFDNIYMLDNQPLLPEKLVFSIDRDDNVTVSEAVFRTIKLYLDG